MSTDTLTRDQLDEQAYLTLRAHDGNGTRAAEALGLARTTFRARISRYQARMEQDAAATESQVEQSEQPAETPAPVEVEVEADAGVEDVPAEVEEPEVEVEQPAAEEEPAKRSTYRPKPADKKCACGCGGLTARQFVRGHDSLYGKKLRAAFVAEEMTQEEVLAAAKAISDRFHGKMVRSLANVNAAAEAKRGGQCACGCGEASERTFVRGHDSKYATKLRAAYRGSEMTREQVLEAAAAISDRFHGKLTRALDKEDAKAAA